MKSKVKPTTTKKPKRRKKRKPDIKRYLMIGFIFLAMISFIFTSLPPMTGSRTSSAGSSANTGGNAATAASGSSAAPTFKEEGSLKFLKSSGELIREIRLEVADDQAQRAQGMMYRKSVPTDTGMIFLFDEEAPQSFWMKNTYVPLDIIFVSADKKIVNIHQNTTPLSEQRYPSTAPAKYVVEVAAGYTAAYGINPGDEIDFVVR